MLLVYASFWTILTDDLQIEGGDTVDKNYTSKKRKRSGLIAILNIYPYNFLDTLQEWIVTMKKLHHRKEMQDD